MDTATRSRARVTPNLPVGSGNDRCYGSRLLLLLLLLSTKMVIISPQVEGSFETVIFMKWEARSETMH